jgi:hypothetical protein
MAKIYDICSPLSIGIYDIFHLVVYTLSGGQMAPEWKVARMAPGDDSGQGVHLCREGKAEKTLQVDHSKPSRLMSKPEQKK